MLGAFPPDPPLKGPSPLASLLLPLLPPSYAPRSYTAKGGPEGKGRDPKAQQASWGRVGGGNTLCTSPDPLILEGPYPSVSPPLPTPCPCPRTPAARGGLGERRTRSRRPAGFLGPEWVGETPATPPLILWSWRVTPPLSTSPPLPPSSLPPTPLGPMGLEGAPENGGPGLGAQQVSWGLSWWGKCPPCLP